MNSSAPPPPPVLNGTIPARRIATQPQPEIPSCVQNAMLTKDKKPFTYTPGGIDLSQIKSPRMAQRISRNANMEGVTNQPKPSPLAQVSIGDYSLVLIMVDTYTHMYCFKIGSWKKYRFF